MAEYRNRRLRKRAHGGAASGEGEGPPHGHHGVMLIIGIGPKKPKKKKGGHVEGKTPRHHLGKRARGGASCYASGGHTEDARDASHDPDVDTGDEVDEGSGTEERAIRQDRARGGGAHAHRTPSGGIKASARHAAESRGHTMPGGGFPIESAKDLANAKHDVGRAKNPEAARRWINKRARELGEPPLGG
jgi:hypothetical protein